MNEPRYRIGTLARMTGVTTHAIRIWERRYAALSPDRTPGGARLYTDADVQRLRAIKQLLERGYAISAVAKLEPAALDRLAGARSSSGRGASSNGRARAAIDELLSALSALDMERATHTLTQAANGFAPYDFVVEVLAPALNEIGVRWASGELCTASEHAASAMLRTQLGSLLAAQSPDARAPVICTTPAGEGHELGALLVAVLIAMRGRRPLYLGANLPAEQIAHAARLSGAGAVALSIVGLEPASARHELDALCKALPSRVQVLIGGKRAAELTGLPERVEVVATLAELEGWLGSTAH